MEIIPRVRPLSPEARVLRVGSGQSGGSSGDRAQCASAHFRRIIRAPRH